MPPHDTEKLTQIQISLARLEAKVDTLIEKENDRKVARVSCEEKFRKLECAKNQAVGGWKLAGLLLGSGGLGGAIAKLISMNK